MQALICDFCGKNMNGVPEDKRHAVHVDDQKYDICEECLNAPVILSETRRVRRRRSNRREPEAPEPPQSKARANDKQKS